MKISRNIQVRFLKKLAFLLSIDGMILQKALSKIEEKADKKLSSEATYIIDALEDNESIYNAFIHFDERVRSIVSLFNDLNKLHDGIINARDLLEREVSMFKQSVFELFMPTVVVVGELLLLAVLSKFALGTFKVMMPIEKWPLVSKIAYYLGDCIYNYWPVLFIVIFGIVFSYNVTKNTLIGSFRDLLDQYIPMYKRYAKIHGIQLLTTLSYIIQKQDVVLARALSSLMDNSSPYLQYHIKQIFENLGGNNSDDGVILADSFDTGLLSPNDISDLRIAAEESKNISYAIIEVTKEKMVQYEDEIKANRIKNEIIIMIITNIVSILVVSSTTLLALNLSDVYH